MVEQIIGKSVTVLTNDQNTFEQINTFDSIIISPGPGIPYEAGNLLEMISYFSDKKPILGVCLGMQAIAEVYGGKLINLPEIYHGTATEAIRIQEHQILENLPAKIQVGRYHSWAVNPQCVPDNLMVTSVDQTGNIMSLKHKTLEVHGVQYHPESILTPYGKNILNNFLNLAG